MTFDQTVPKPLKETQQWFASIITRPIDIDSHMNPISPTGVPISQEACRYIMPSPTLKPAQRIELYNQQYWWRLLSALHENFPLVTSLFGFTDFNQAIGFPYLVKYPPNHWSLSLLGDCLPQWIQEEYTADDNELIYYAAQVDLAYVKSFLAESKPSLKLQGDISSVIDKPLHLQPHAHLFEIPYDIFEFRFHILKNAPDYWLEHDFPPLPRMSNNEKLYFILYRAHNLDIVFEKISFGQYHLLQQFSKGTSIEQLCQWLEQQDERVCEEAGEHMQKWFQKWTMHQLLSENDH